MSEDLIIEDMNKISTCEAKGGIVIGAKIKASSPKYLYDFDEANINSYSENRLNASDFTSERAKSIFLIQDDPPECLVLSSELSIKDILDQIFDFITHDSCDCPYFKKGELGTKEYFGKTVDNIIYDWEHDKNSTDAAWIYKKFQEDIFTENLNLGNAESILLAEKTEIQLKLSKGMANFPEMFSHRRRYNFIEKFCEALLSYTDEYGTIISTSTNESHQKYNSLLSSLADITSVSCKQNGECRYVSVLLEDVKDGKLKSLVTKPDFMFQSDSQHFILPVEVYCPKLEIAQLFESTRMNELFDSSQKIQELDKLMGQHVVKLLAILHYRIKNNLFRQGTITDNTKLIQTGLFMTRRFIRLTKVLTTKRHMVAFFPDLHHGSGYRPKVNLEIREEKGISVLTSKWCIDLSKFNHRNALIVFLAHVFHSVNNPVQEFT